MMRILIVVMLFVPFRFALGQATAAPQPDAVADLPLIELPAPAGNRLAVIVSGDGGWAAIDRELGNRLVARGIAVVGLDSLKYFWRKRDPDSAAQDFARFLGHYMVSWRRSEFLLIGYSFGADVLPFLASRLPADLRRHTARLVLLSPARATGFEIKVGGWLGREAEDGAPTQPEIAKLLDLQLLCVYGQDEGNSICRELKGANIRTHGLLGSHHYGGDYDALATAILGDLD